jgi:hypothetical protein
LLDVDFSNDRHNLLLGWLLKLSVVDYYMDSMKKSGMDEERHDQWCRS